MFQGEHSAILSTFIKLPFVIMIFVLSIFEWPLKTGFTVLPLTNFLVVCGGLADVYCFRLSVPPSIFPFMCLSATIWFFFKYLETPRSDYENIPTLLCPPQVGDLTAKS